MKGRTVLGLMLSAMLLLLAAGSGLAGGPRATGEAAGKPANAPWFISEVDTPGNTGQHTSVAINPSNRGTYISYYDATNKALRMAMNRGFGVGNCGPNNDWLCQTIDSGADFGRYSSIAIAPGSGEIGIAYYDASHGKLKYAHGKICPTCSWSIDTVDEPILFPTDSTGKYTSLKVDSNGKATIAYYFENTSGVDALMVASSVPSGGNCGAGSAAGQWQCDTIKTGEGVGQYASLALDSSNDFHIAYYDATNDVLQYAVDVGSGGNCGVLGSARCDEIDSMPAGYHPLGVSIAEDAGGYPVIAYQAANTSLNVARPVPALGLPGGSGNCGPENPFATWSCETIDPHGQRISYRNGDYVSMAIGPSGLATVAYYGRITSSDGNLRVAYQRFQAFLPLVMKNQ